MRIPLPLSVRFSGVRASAYALGRDARHFLSPCQPPLLPYFFRYVIWKNLFLFQARLFSVLLWRPARAAHNKIYPVHIETFHFREITFGAKIPPPVPQRALFRGRRGGADW